MKDVTAIYLGKIVSKKNFRAYIYAPDGSQKLVESWDSYEKHMETGLWFATKEDAELSKISSEPEKPKQYIPPKPKSYLPTYKTYSQKRPNQKGSRSLLNY